LHALSILSVKVCVEAVTVAVLTTKLRTWSATYASSVYYGIVRSPLAATTNTGLVTGRGSIS
jgi:hypothetical protein